jgi:methionyl-tRNA formyltransferase
LNNIVPSVKKLASDIKIFIDGQAILSHAITRKLIENHNISPKNIIVNTYNRADSTTYINWLNAQGITCVKESYQNDKIFNLVKDFNPDYIISAYGLRIIPKKILDLAQIIAFNLHPSYLPDYKGRWIPSWVIINGEIEHGITIHAMDEGIDTGPILFQKKLPVSIDDTAYSLYNKIMCHFVIVFDNFFQDLINGKIVSKPMPSGGRYFGKNIPFDGTIDPSWNIEKIEKFIRSMFYPPHKGAEFKNNKCVYECLTLEDYLNIVK